jgi:signal transduction histidine kinase
MKEPPLSATEEPLRQQDELADLREKLARHERFLSTLAHEMRNCLYTIMLSADTWQRAPEHGDTCSATLVRQTRQLTRMAEDLGDSGRIAQRRLSLKVRETDLRTILQDAIAGCRPVIEEARHTLSVQIPDEPFPLKGDPDRLLQVLINLIGNAIKYTPEGGLLALSAKKDGSCAEVSVRDNGTGIPPDKLDAVFVMFEQLEPHTTAGARGLGIGLSLAKSLVEMHGGEIWAKSDGAGRGTEVSFRLPLSERP